MKDSGIEWVREIPLDWEVLRNGNAFTMGKEIVRSDSATLQLLSLTTKGVKEKNIDDVGGKQPESFDSYQLVKQNDLIMCLFDLDCSAVFSGVSRYNGMISPAYKVLVCNERIKPQFADYWFRFVGYDRKFMWQAKNLRYTLSYDEFKWLPIVRPPIPTQTAIANYLDDKCGKIDTLIANEEKAIAELKEYKKAVVRQYIKNGVYKHNIIESNSIWFDKIPQDWKMLRGKYVLKLLDRPVLEIDGVVTCFRDGDVTLRSNRREDGFTIAEKEIGYQGIEPNDLVIHGMDGFAGAIGVSDARGKGSPVLNVCQSKENVKYLMYYLRSLAYDEVFTALSTGIRVRSCDLRWNKIADMDFAIPERKEQDLIVEKIETALTLIDKTIGVKQKKITEIKEYKKSLIYEYVTGKRSAV